MLKFKSKYSEKDIRLMYETCCLHASMGDNFGVFCLGAGIALRSIFSFLQKGDRTTIFNINTQESVASTMIMLDGFDGAVLDMGMAIGERIDNENTSSKIRALAEEVRRKRDEKH